MGLVLRAAFISALLLAFSPSAMAWMGLQPVEGAEQETDAAPDAADGNPAERSAENDETEEAEPAAEESPEASAAGSEPPEAPTSPESVPETSSPPPSGEIQEEIQEEPSARESETSSDAAPSTSDDDATTWQRDSERLRLDLGLTYATFEQQVKSEVGGTTVEPLVEDRAFGIALTATYGVWKYIRLGLFFQLDIGSRFASRYSGLDATGTPIVMGRIGGSYREFWMGPLLRVQWRGLAAEFGYGALGVRSDDARDDLATAAGGTGAFRTSPRIAWHAAISGYVPVHPHIDIVFRVQYRVRYYDRRSGDALAADVVHGTQNLTPTVGVSWRL